MPVLSITFFGGCHITYDGVIVNQFRSNKAVGLLAFLVVEADRAHARSMLAALFWPDQPDERALRNLSQAVVHLRKALGPAASSAGLHTTRSTIAWRRNAAETDVAAFLRRAASGELDDLEIAAKLYTGEFMAGFEVADCQAFEEWMLRKREQFHQQALAVLERLANQHEASGRYVEAADTARSQLALDSWHEPAYRQLMRALAAMGDRAGALVVYERCRQILLEAFGASPDPATIALANNLQQSQPDQPLIREPVSNLPAPLTPLIGREQEALAIETLLQSGARLVTLRGPGGVGKTRLALAVAQRLQTAFAGGVYWVELAAISGDQELAVQGDQLAEAMLSALEPLRRDEGAPLDEVLRGLRARSVLIVLDNCEHLTVVGAVLRSLLEAAPGLHVLATSRERLGVYGEEVVVLDGLPVALAEGGATHHSPAVDLFLTRARHQLHGLAANRDLLEAVARLCNLLEGMPLGIELAAHWVGEFTPDEIAAAIHTDLAFLHSRYQSSHGRQHSMHAVFTYSWGLLTEHERRILARLSVFVGGFDHTAALHVAEAQPATLATLVDKSLLRRVGIGRYSMHKLLRQFSAEQLDSMGDARHRTEANHSRFYLAFVAARDRRLAREQPYEAAAEIQKEFDNIRQAWVWAVTQNSFVDVEAAAKGIWLFSWVIGQRNEVERIFAFAYHQLNASRRSQSENAQTTHTRSIIQALYALSVLNMFNPDQVIGSSRQALEGSQAGTEAEIIASFAWAHALYRQGERHEARIRSERVLEQIEAFQQGQATSEIVYILHWNVYLLLRAIDISFSNFNEALGHASKALELCRTRRSQIGEAHCLWNLADVAREVYDLPTAQRSYERALSLLPTIVAPFARVMMHYEYGEVLRLQGDYRRAYSLIEFAARTFNEQGHADNTYLATAGLVRLLALLGDAARAEPLLTQLDQLEDRVKIPEIQLTARLAVATFHYWNGSYPQALAVAENCCVLANGFNHAYAQAHSFTLLGHIRVAMGEPDAEIVYQEALQRYAAMSNPGLATEVLAGIAALRFASGKLDEAMSYVESIFHAVDARQRIGLDEPFAVYLTCCQVLAAANDPRADELLRVVHLELLRWADAITDPNERLRFLTGMPTHRAILVFEEQRAQARAPQGV